jgi:hypothetical protein
MSFNFRETEGVAAHTGSRTVLDDGDHVVMISGSSFEDGKKANGSKNIVLEYTVLGGNFAGQTVKEWLSVVNPSEIAQNIARSKAEALRIITKLRQDQGSDDFVGKEMIIRTKKKANQYLTDKGETRTGYNAEIVLYMTKDRTDASGKVIAAFIPTAQADNTTYTGTSSSSTTNTRTTSSGGDDEIPF